MSDKETAQAAYLAAWNQVDSMDSMTDLEERTAIQHFESWWQGLCVECDNCGESVTDPWETEADEIYCGTPCIMAAQTGRPKEDFEASDYEIPDFQEQEVKHE